MTRHDFIELKGAHQHNLKDLNIKIPRNQITVVTGVSGSGKSSFVFDTLLKESQRRFFYTLSYYTRKYLDIGARPKIKSLKGISPAIGLSQNETRPSVRASVGTLSDFTELLGVFLARFAKRFCPKHQLSTQALSADEICTLIEKKYSTKTVTLLAPIVTEKKGNFRIQMQKLADKGFLRAFVDGELSSMSPVPKLHKDQKHSIKLVVDSIKIQPSCSARLKRAVLLALEYGKEFIELGLGDVKNFKLPEIVRYSSQGACPKCHYSWPLLDARYFSANSLGRCPSCKGLGSTTILEDLSDYQEELAEEQTNFSIELMEKLAKKLKWSHLSEAYACKDCCGTGLSKLYGAIKFENYSASDFHSMSFAEFLSFWQNIRQKKLDLFENESFLRLYEELEIIARRFVDIGLAYLTPKRRVLSLSGGEFQRMRLAEILATKLRGVIYIFDEPSQGLHPKELETLQKNLESLKKLGNTIVMVDHDEYLIRRADLIIELGPGGGRKGGELVASFAPKEAKKFSKFSPTAKMLLELKNEKINLSKSPPTLEEEEHARKFISIEKASLHNLRNISVSFEHQALNVVTGLSGAGKSSLVIQSLYPALSYYLEEKKSKKSQKKNSFWPLALMQPFTELKGVEDFLKIDLIDRKSLSRSGQSMPVSYLGAWTYIRELYASLPEAQFLGLTARSFSLQSNEGRCDLCSGKGVVSLNMRFLPDAKIICSQCGGSRFKELVQNIKYKDKSLTDVLEMTLDEACEFFRFHPKVVRFLEPARKLGLTYLQLGQSSASLSGGEVQRLRLAPYLKKGGDKKSTLLILEEPTHGLHSQDVDLLIKVISDLIALGLTLIVIEHNPSFICAANRIIDLGPGSAANGGRLLYQGRVRELIENGNSPTAHSLREWLSGKS